MNFFKVNRYMGIILIFKKFHKLYIFRLCAQPYICWVETPSTGQKVSVTDQVKPQFFVI